MARQVADLEILSEYLDNVILRAVHHAPNVDEIALALVGAILWKKDDKQIELFERDGEVKNVLWVWIGDTRYAFSYNHNTQEIEMRKNSTHGAVIKVFSNSTPLADLKSFFDNL
ncbi:MAG: hypothetical protein V1797_16660 [Pseudomonadota bacterium]